MANDLSLKGNYAMSQLSSAIKSIVKKNEDAGYIYAWNKWRSPAEIAKIIIKYYSHK